MPGECPVCEGNGVAIYDDGDSGDCLACDGSGLNEDAVDEQLVFPLIGGGCDCIPSSSNSNTNLKEQSA